MLQPLSNYLDMTMYATLQMYFAPYRLPEQLGEVEKITGIFTMDGIRPLCNTKR